MNTCIQMLNDWGENFLSFAWPMLWQSSLLIAVVFALDALLARRIRAAVRYALWLAVLVKLLLPPALALPTGATWWLWPAKPPLTPVINSEVVTYDTPVSPPPVSVPHTVPMVQPPLELSGAGWAMLSYGAIGMTLLLWLALRWLRVAMKVRRAGGLGAISAGEMHAFRSLSQRLRRFIFNRPVQDATDTGKAFAVPGRDAEIIEILQDVCQLAGLRRCPRLKLMDDNQSPAVYGLFRPVILLPRALTEKLSARQFRAVLLHEAMHLRRGDVWVNCAQTLLQIAYWWHPLLWLANARLRRLREEAVDDAVMLALRNDADAYAPTLLAVAKFSFRRPLSGLALVGILESRSALRRRIERLVDFRPPRRPGLTALSLCGILAFSAVALPMGQGPAEINPSATPPKADPKNQWPNANFEGIGSVNLAAATSKVPETTNKIEMRATVTQPVLVEDEYATPPDISRQTASALNQALVAERSAAHMVLIAQAEINRSPPPSVPGIDPATGLPVSTPAPKNSINGTNALEMRTFHVEPRSFPTDLQMATGVPIYNDDISAALKQLFAKVGVDLSPPKQLYYGDRLGNIFVYATPQDLKVIEQTLNEVQRTPPPMVHIKARFIEVPTKFFVEANSLPAGLTNGGVLSQSRFRKLLRQLESYQGTKELAEPEVTTICGRQTKMRATITQPIVMTYTAVMHPTNLNYVEVAHSTNLYAPQTTPIETGPVLDVMPRALPDGYTLDLDVIALDTKFFGYANSSDLPPRHVNAYWGGVVAVPTALPAVQSNLATAQKTLYDGQTVALFPVSAPNYLGDGSNKKLQERVANDINAAEKADGNKVLVVFVTATLIDAAGNRVHSEEEMPFAQNNVPRQPPSSSYRLDFPTP